MVAQKNFRVDSFLGGLAVKAPCKAVAIANITLSGEQTVNGVAVVAGDRVLVTAQTTDSENGIYEVETSAWTRAADFNGNRDVVSGTFVTVATATVGRNPFYQITTADPIVIGTTAINFTLADGPNVSFALTTTEAANGLTVNDINDSFFPGHVTRYGNVGDGDGAGGGTNNAVALQRAFDAGHEINFGDEALTWRTDSSITRTGDTSIRAPKGTKIDGSNITGGLSAIIDIRGAGETSLGSPNANPTALTRTIAFAATPSIAADDVYLIYNSTDGSWSDFRTNYRAGEWGIVRDLSGSTINTTSYLYDTYVAANVTIYKIATAKVFAENLEFVMPNTLTVGIKLTFCRGSELKGIRGEGIWKNGLIEIERSIGVVVRDPHINNRQTSASGNEYGILITNSQHVRVVDPDVSSLRHAVTITGGNFIGAVPCRDCWVEGGYLSTTGVSSAADLHGITEHCGYRGVHINGGITMGGDNNSVIDCDIFGGGEGSACVYHSEMKGWNFTYQGGRYTGLGGAANRGSVFDCGGNNAAQSATGTTSGGTLKIEGVTMVDNTASPSSAQMVRIRNNGSTATHEIHLLDIDYQSTTLRNVSIDDAIGTDGHKRILIRGHDADFGAIDVKEAELIDLEDIHIIQIDTAIDGVSAQMSVNNGRISGKNIVIDNPTQDGITFSGTGGATGVLASLDHCTVRNSVSSFFGIELNSVETGQMFHCFSSGAATELRANTVTNLIAFGNNEPVSRASVTNDAEIGFDGSHLIMKGLATSTPGGTDRVWNNSNDLNIT